VLGGYDDSVTALAFSPDGRQVASACSRTGTIRIWKISAGTWNIKKELKGCYFSFGGWTRFTMAFSPDGNALAFISRYRYHRAMLWYRGCLFSSWRDYAQIANAVAFSPNGKFVAVSFSGKIVILWDLEPVFLYSRCTDFMESLLLEAKHIDMNRGGEASKQIAEYYRGTTKKPASLKAVRDEPIRIFITEGDVKLLSFSKCGQFLVTDRGILDISISSDGPTTQAARPSSFWNSHGEWLCSGPQRILWLPTEFRPTYLDTHGNTVAMILPSQRVSLIELNTQNICSTKEETEPSEDGKKSDDEAATSIHSSEPSVHDCSPNGTRPIGSAQSRFSQDRSVQSNTPDRRNKLFGLRSSVRRIFARTSSRK
jgi:hypothetical protein